MKISTFYHNANGKLDCFLGVTSGSETLHFYNYRTKKEIKIYKTSDNTVSFNFKLLDLEYYQGVCP